MRLKKKNFWEIPSNTNSGILGFLENIIRSHPLIYLITRNLIRYTNIFEEDANGVKYIKFKSKLNIMDIGASDGIAAKFFLKNLNVKKIICFEPNFKFLKKLKKLGNKKLINIKNFAIGPKNENAIVYYPVYSLLGKKFTLDTFCYYNKKVLEKQINLDFKFKKNIKIEKKILKIKKFKNKNINIDLIKIDVNGFELSVLKGLINIIKKNTPALLIETNKDTLKIKKLLKKYSYNQYIFSVVSNKFKEAQNNYALNTYFLQKKHFF